MPQRFIEVLDVASEASGIFSHFLSRGGDFVSGVSLNISQYINATTGQYDVNLLSYLTERYNISTDDVLNTMSMLNLTNSTIGTVPPPKGMAGWLIVAGVVVLLARAALIRWQAKAFVRKWGHAHAE